MANSKTKVATPAVLKVQPTSVKKKKKEDELEDSLSAVSDNDSSSVNNQEESTSSIKTNKSAYHVESQPTATNTQKSKSVVTSSGSAYHIVEPTTSTESKTVTTPSGSAYHVTAPTTSSLGGTNVDSIASQYGATEKWWSGDTPTVSEMNARAWKLYQNDDVALGNAQSQITALTQEKGSPWYNPYTTATNSGYIDELTNLGVDCSTIDDNFFTNNAGYQQYLTLNASGTAKTPTTKSSNEEKIAYYIYQLQKDEDTTKKAESEWNSMVSEITYWANKGYSDDEIVAKLDASSDYSTLKKMDTQASYGTPLALNRAIGYSSDAVKGVIWAARTGTSSGDYSKDAVYYAMGVGKGYSNDKTKAEQRDVTSANYNPYVSGSTMDDMNMYFGVTSYDQNWINENSWMQNSADATQRKNFATVYAAEQTTQKAEAERDAVYSWIDSNITAGASGEEIAKALQEAYDGDSDMTGLSFTTLKSMDTARKKGSSVSLTRSVDWRLEDALSYAQNGGSATASATTGKSNVAAQVNKGKTTSTATTAAETTAEQQPVQAEESTSKATNTGYTEDEYDNAVATRKKLQSKADEYQKKIDSYSDESLKEHYQAKLDEVNKQIENEDTIISGYEGQNNVESTNSAQAQEENPTAEAETSKQSANSAENVDTASTSESKKVINSEASADKGEKVVEQAENSAEKADETTAEATNAEEQTTSTLTDEEKAKKIKERDSWIQSYKDYQRAQQVSGTVTNDEVMDATIANINRLTEEIGDGYKLTVSYTNDEAKSVLSDVMAGKELNSDQQAVFDSFYADYGALFGSTQYGSEDSYRAYDQASMQYGKTASTALLYASANDATTTQYVDTVMQIVADSQSAEEAGMSLDDWYNQNPDAKERVLQVQTDLQTTREAKAQAEAEQAEANKKAMAETGINIAVKVSNGEILTDDEQTFYNSITNYDSTALRGSDSSFQTRDDHIVDMMIGGDASDASAEWQEKVKQAGFTDAETATTATQYMRDVIANDAALASACGMTLDELYTAYPQLEKTDDELLEMATAHQIELDTAGTDTESKAGIGIWKSVCLGFDSGANSFVSNKIGALMALTADNTESQTMATNYQTYVGQYGISGARYNYDIDVQTAISEMSDDDPKKATYQQMYSEAKTNGTDIFTVPFEFDQEALKKVRNVYQDRIDANQQFVMENGTETEQWVYGSAQDVASNSLDMGSAMLLTVATGGASAVGTAMSFGATELGSRFVDMIDQGYDVRTAKTTSLLTAGVTTLLETGMMGTYLSGDPWVDALKDAAKVKMSETIGKQGFSGIMRRVGTAISGYGKVALASGLGEALQENVENVATGAVVWGTTGDSSEFTNAFNPQTIWDTTIQTMITTGAFLLEGGAVNLATKGVSSGARYVSQKSKEAALKRLLKPVSGQTQNQTQNQNQTQTQQTTEQQTQAQGQNVVEQNATEQEQQTAVDQTAEQEQQAVEQAQEQTTDWEDGQQVQTRSIEERLQQLGLSEQEKEDFDVYTSLRMEEMENSEEVSDEIKQKREVNKAAKEQLSQAEEEVLEAEIAFEEASKNKKSNDGRTAYKEARERLAQARENLTKAEQTVGEAKTQFEDSTRSVAQEKALQDVFEEKFGQSISEILNNPQAKADMIDARSAQIVKQMIGQGAMETETITSAQQKVNDADSVMAEAKQSTAEARRVMQKTKRQLAKALENASTAEGAQQVAQLLGKLAQEQDAFNKENRNYTKTQKAKAQAMTELNEAQQAQYKQIQQAARSQAQTDITNGLDSFNQKRAAQQAVKQAIHATFAEDVSEESKRYIDKLPRAATESTTGVVYRGTNQTTLSKNMSQQIEVLDKLAKRLGLQVNLYDNIDNVTKNGSYQSGTNIINIAMDADANLLTRTFSHKITSYIKEENSNSYESMQSFVLDKLNNTEGYDLAKRIAERIEKAKQSGIEMTEAEAREEIVADNMLDVLSDEATLQQFAEQDLQTALSFRNKLSNYASELKQMTKGMANKEARAMANQSAQDMQTLRDKLTDATKTAENRLNQATQDAESNFSDKEGTIDAQEETESQSETVNGLTIPSPTTESSTAENNNIHETEDNGIRVPQSELTGKAKNSPMKIMERLAQNLGVGWYYGINDRTLTTPVGEINTDKATSTSSTLKVDTTGQADTKARTVRVSSTQASNLDVTLPLMAQQLQSIAGKEGTSSSQILNGNTMDFANFFTDYMRGGRDVAVSRYGDTVVQDFEQALDRKQRSSLRQAQKDINAFMRSSSIERAKAMTVDSNEKGKHRNTTVADFFRNKIVSIADDSDAASRVDHMARKQGLEAAKQTDMYSKMRLTKFNERKAAALVTQQLTNYKDEVIGDSLSETLNKAGITTTKQLDMLTNYAELVHSVEREANNSTMFGNAISQADIQEQIADIQREHPEVAAAQKAMSKWWYDCLHGWMVESGMMSEKSFQNYKKKYPNYIPTFRDLTANKTGTDTMRAKGSDMDIVNPIDSMLLGVKNMVDKVKTNEVMQIFDDYYQSGVGFGVFAQDISDTVENPSLSALTIEDMTMLLSEPAIQKDSANGDKSLLGGTISFVDKTGKHKTYQFDDLTLFNAISQSTAQNAAKALQAVKKVTNTMAMLTTGSNPLFAPRNAIRDFQQSVNKGSWAVTYVDGAYKWLKTAFEVGKAEFGGEVSETLQEYYNMGGGGFTRFDTKSGSGVTEMRRQLVDSYRSNPLQKGWQALKSLVTMEKINGAVETTSRYVEYKLGKHDLSTYEGRQKAFLDAQTVTTDFSKRGNGTASAALRSIIPFYNATLQGSYQAVRELVSETDRSRLAARATKTVLNSALTGALQIAVLNAFGSDDDKEWYQKLAQEMREDNIIIPLSAESPRQFIRLPVTQDPWGKAAYILGTNIALGQVGMGEAATGILDTAKYIVSGMLPDDLITSGITDVLQNKTWYGSSLVPEYMEDRSTTEQYKDSTPTMYVTTSRMLSQAGVNISPIALQYLASQYTGFIGTMVNAAFSLDSNGNLNTGRELYEVVRNKFTIDPAYTNDIDDSYTSRINMFDQIATDVGDLGYSDWLNTSLTAGEAKQAINEVAEMTNKGGIVYETKADIKELYAMMSAVDEDDSLTDDQKEEECRDIKREIVLKEEALLEATSEFNEKYCIGSDPFSFILNGGAKTSSASPVAKYGDVFTADENEDYMVKAMEVYDETGLTNSVPHPNTSVTIDGSSYDVMGSDYKDDYLEVYKEAYADAMSAAKGGYNWDSKSIEEKQAVLKDAHSEAQDKATKWLKNKVAGFVTK